MMPTRVEALAPTQLEYWALRVVKPAVEVRRCGVRLSDRQRRAEFDATVTCGLAGSLLAAVEPGTVLIPQLVRAPDGSVARCDPMLWGALMLGARSLGFNPETGPLLTSENLITGSARDDWARRGFVAADMETGLVAATSPRFASVRVVLDSPSRPISDHWLAPSRAAQRPSLWSELIWLAYVAPRYALRAARVLKAGLTLEPSDDGEHQPQ
jgi:hypothetical protein